MKWALTGTPGTGKTTVASLLDGPVTHLSALLEDPSFRTGYDDARETAIADVDALADWLEDQPDGILVESHLAHRLPIDRVIVLRCHPDVLRDRLEGREADITDTKIEENVEAERLDVILAEAIDRHGTDGVHEIDTTDRDPEDVAELVASIRAGHRAAPPGRVSFLGELRPVAAYFVYPTARLAAAIGLTPNSVSVLALGAAIAAGGAFAVGEPGSPWYLVGAGLVFANGWLDLVDGALAREHAVDSAKGDLLDHVLDRYADIVIIGGLAAGVGHWLLGFAAVTGVLMTSYLGTQAMAVGLDRVYAGLLGRADRLALVGVVAVIAVAYPVEYGGYTAVGWLLVVLAVVGHLTALQRFVGAMRDLP